MKEFEIEKSDWLRFVRVSNSQFSIQNDTKTIISLSDSVGRRVWFALSVQQFTKTYCRIYDSRLVSFIPALMGSLNSYIFANFHKGSNCHGTAHEVMFWTGSISSTPWWRTAKFNIDNALDRQKECPVEKNEFPALLYDAHRGHSIVVLGKTARAHWHDSHVIIFDKMWYMFPFRLVQEPIWYLENFRHYISAKQK